MTINRLDDGIYSSICDNSENISFSLSYTKLEQYTENGRRYSSKVERMIACPTLAIAMAHADVLKDKIDISAIHIYEYNAATGSKRLIIDNSKDVSTIQEQSSTPTKENSEPRITNLKMQLATCKEELEKANRKLQNTIPFDFATKALEQAVSESMQGTAALVMEMLDDGWDIGTIYNILSEIAQGKYKPPAYINDRKRLFPPDRDAIQGKINEMK